MFDNNLRYAREELEMTQSELGYIFGVSDSAVRSWETAHDSIPLPKLIKFCDMYDFSLDFICGLIRKNITYGHFKTDKVKISKKLKELRKSLNLSQQKLSDDCKNIFKVSVNTFIFSPVDNKSLQYKLYLFFLFVN